jgi:hypothetical protein
MGEQRRCGPRTPKDVHCLRWAARAPDLDALHRAMDPRTRRRRSGVVAVSGGRPRRTRRSALRRASFPLHSESTTTWLRGPLSILTKVSHTVGLETIRRPRQAAGGRRASAHLCVRPIRSDGRRGVGSRLQSTLHEDAPAGAAFASVRLGETTSPSRIGKRSAASSGRGGWRQRRCGGALLHDSRVVGSARYEPDGLDGLDGRFPGRGGSEATSWPRHSNERVVLLRAPHMRSDVSVPISRSRSASRPRRRWRAEGTRGPAGTPPPFATSRSPPGWAQRADDFPGVAGTPPDAPSCFLPGWRDADLVLNLASEHAGEP